MFLHLPHCNKTIDIDSITMIDWKFQIEKRFVESPAIRVINGVRIYFDQTFYLFIWAEEDITILKKCIYDISREQ